jgi:hypothetical protein
MLANLLAVAEAHGVRARLLFGFRDTALCRLLGVDGRTEFPVVVIPLDSTAPDTTAPDGTAHPPTDEPGRLRVATTPLSRAPIEFRLITAAQDAGRLNDAEQVRAWRDRFDPGFGTPSTVPRPPTAHAQAAEPIETVIVRRGSTRLMRRTAVPSALLTWAMACATRPAPIDALPAGATLLSHYLSVHAVDGFEPGLYHLAHGEFVVAGRTSTAEARVTASHLCLDQALGGDSGYTLFACADLDQSLDRLGDRGYRVIQTEAGIAVGRLQLAAFALGHGATGLTFYDDEIAATFATRAACMMACSVGLPDYRSVSGGTPGRPTELTRLGSLTARLVQREQRS